MKNLPLAIKILTAVTALVHLALVPGYFTPEGGGLMSALPFILNGIGYLALLVVYFKWLPLPFQIPQLWVAYAFMGFTVVTIVAYFAVNQMASFSNLMGLADKVVEGLLLYSLWQHVREGQA